MSAVAYDDFVAAKLATVPGAGIDVANLREKTLFPFQRDLVTWAIRRGRAALFADTGLGKTRMELHWARRVAAHTKGRVLVLAPLSVARQTAKEGDAIGVKATVAASGEECDAPGIYVTNYDKLHRFDGVAFDAVVLDESSCIKHHNAKTLTTLLDRFKSTPYKLCASATPSPNDYTELGTHAEFLGVCSRTEMLAEYFVHDGGETSVWRLKGHARPVFWRWVASWAALIRLPSDIGYDDAGYVLPSMRVHEHVSAASHESVASSGLLFAAPASSLSERRSARRASMSDRVGQCVETVNADPGEQWVVWCDLNSEQDALADALGPQCVSIQGANTSEEKEARHDQWIRGEARILISKPSIFGFGLNWQHCARMAFVGVTDSFESYYQAVRRCYRFGQRREVDVHIFSSELEGNVLANLKRKQSDAERMGAELSLETKDAVKTNLLGSVRSVNRYESRHIVAPAWMNRRAPDDE